MMGELSEQGMTRTEVMEIVLLQFIPGSLESEIRFSDACTGHLLPGRIPADVPSRLGNPASS